jgi:1,6-anhydro-N-acetylmuramate kinase
VVSPDIITDFRRADCAAQGQGAPLVPYVDRLLYAPLRARLRMAPAPDAAAPVGRVLVNLGGIANITLLPPPLRQSPPRRAALAFDTGPANVLSDYAARCAMALRIPVPEGAPADGPDTASASEEPSLAPAPASAAACVFAMGSRGEVRVCVAEGAEAGADGGVAEAFIDDLTRHGFDRGGRIALRGRVLPVALCRFLQDEPYFRRAAPKSCDIVEMIRGFNAALSMCAAAPSPAAAADGEHTGGATTLRLEDVLATACAATAEALARGILQGIDELLPEQSEPQCRWEVGVSGGGVENGCIMAMLRDRLGVAADDAAAAWGAPAVASFREAIRALESTEAPGAASRRAPRPSEISLLCRVDRLPGVEAYKISPESKEAVAFAILAATTMDRTPGNVPDCTGAAAPAVLGCVYPGQRIYSR